MCEKRLTVQIFVLKPDEQHRTRSESMIQERSRRRRRRDVVSRYFCSGFDRFFREVGAWRLI